MRRLRRIVEDELGNIAHLRLALATLLLVPVPPLMACRLRAALHRLGGVRVRRGTLLAGGLRIEGPGDAAGRIEIDTGCWINTGCLLDASAAITIERNVAIGQNVSIITGTHEIGSHLRRAGELIARPVRIGAGSWLGAGTVVLPGVVVGAGAIVAAGSVVTRDVEPDTLVAGAPARIVRRLDA